MNQTHRRSRPFRFVRSLAGLALAAIATAGLGLALSGLFAAGASERPEPAPAPPFEDPPAEDRAPDPDEPAPALADGRHFGRIDGAWVGPAELAFDEMELLIGEDARRAAEADGVEAGDFLVRDAEARTVGLAVSERVVVTRVDCSTGGCHEGTPSDYDELTRTVADGGSGRYWIEIVDGSVVRIDEQYLP